ncbi:Hypp7125 [Branchiostoma lanceolatum]|uniref:Hypp7125 protein n=1 Tax=Branchiostoma lanceolatum TaxID=7740 RepID=A0A8J9YXC8_BRALA|nr:Hypp7125 [Branchiostoma lanceolatum]
MSWIFGRDKRPNSRTVTPERPPSPPGGDDLDGTLRKLQKCRPKEHIKALEDTFELQSDAIGQLHRENWRLETENRELQWLLQDIKDFVEWKCPCPQPRSYRAVPRLANRGRSRRDPQAIFGESNYPVDGGDPRVSVDTWRDWFDSVTREHRSPWYYPHPPTVVPQKQEPGKIICYVKAEGPFHGSDTQLLAKLNERLGKANVAMETRPWQQSLRPVSEPTLVFCLNASRLGTDVDNALRGTEGNNVVLIVMHHRPHHDARISVQSRSVLREVHTKLIVDAVFFEREGLYDCEVNTDAVKDLALYLQSY